MQSNIQPKESISIHDSSSVTEPLLKNGDSQPAEGRHPDREAKTKQVNYPNANEMNSRAVKIRIWHGSPGHVSLETSNIYASVWPNKIISKHRPFESVPAVLSSLSEDELNEKEGRPADSIYQFKFPIDTVLNIEQLFIQKKEMLFDNKKVFWEVLGNQGTPTYGRTYNCVTFVYMLLNSFIHHRIRERGTMVRVRDNRQVLAASLLTVLVGLVLLLTNKGNNAEYIASLVLLIGGASVCCCAYTYGCYMNLFANTRHKYDNRVTTPAELEELVKRAGAESIEDNIPLCGSHNYAAPHLSVELTQFLNDIMQLKTIVESTFPHNSEVYTNILAKLRSFENIDSIGNAMEVLGIIISYMTSFLKRDDYLKLTRGLKMGQRNEMFAKYWLNDTDQGSLNNLISPLYKAVCHSGLFKYLTDKYPFMQTYLDTYTADKFVSTKTHEEKEVSVNLSLAGRANALLLLNIVLYNYAKNTSPSLESDLDIEHANDLAIPPEIKSYQP